MDQKLDDALNQISGLLENDMNKLWDEFSAVKYISPKNRIEFWNASEINYVANSRHFECLFAWQGLREFSLGLNIGFNGPNFSIYLPFCFLRVGWTKMAYATPFLMDVGT